MGELSAWHWLIVIGVAVLLFGAKRLPEAARSLGRSARILKAELRTAEDPAAPSSSPPPAPATPTVRTQPMPTVGAQPPGRPDLT